VKNNFTILFRFATTLRASAMPTVDFAAVTANVSAGFANVMSHGDFHLPILLQYKNVQCL